MIRMISILCLFVSSAWADTVVAGRTIAANSVIEAGDLALSNKDFEGGESDPSLFIGMEARVALYAGRPISRSSVGPPAIVERNQSIPMAYTGR